MCTSSVSKLPVLSGMLNKLVAYIMDPDPEKEVAINVELLARGVTALEHLSPRLEFVVLPTGTKVCSHVERLESCS